MKPELKTKEAAILEALRKRMTRKAIVEEVGIGMSGLNNIIVYLRDLGYIEVIRKGNDNHDVKILVKLPPDGYVTVEKRKYRKHPPIDPEQPEASDLPDPYLTIEKPSEKIAKFIESNYTHMTRSQLAKALGLPKVVLINYMIGLGIGK